MFDQAIIGQAHLVACLARVTGGRRMPHALLFDGPEGSGKTAAALEMAAAIHCEQPQDGACGQCRPCGLLRGGNHPDFSLLFPIKANPRTGEPDPVEEREFVEGVLQDHYFYTQPRDSQVVPIGLVRRLRERFAKGSYEGAWRTAVVLNADRMRPEGANALLKTLEEPPPRSLMILTAPSKASLLPTIVSRCQSLKFQALPTRDVVDWLQREMGQSGPHAQFVARASGGNLRRARELAAGETEPSQDRAIRFLKALVSSDLPTTYTALEQLASDRGDALQLLGDAGLWLRDAMLLREAGPGLVAHQGREDDIRDLGDVLPFEMIEVLVRGIERIREMNRRNVSMHLMLMSLWREARGCDAGRPVEAV